MTNACFLVGDRVRIVDDSYYELLRGFSGRVIFIDGNYLVQFDEPIPAGHSGWGKGKDGYCWWFIEEDLSFESTPIIATAAELFELFD